MFEIKNSLSLLFNFFLTYLSIYVYTVLNTQNPLLRFMIAQNTHTHTHTDAHALTRTRLYLYMYIYVYYNL
jgi:hypothetical protein